MEIGIIGSGNIGRALVGSLTAPGHHVLIANSCGPESLGDIANKPRAIPVITETAAKAKDLVIIAILNKFIDAIGFDAVDGGELSESWGQQPGEPAYCRDLDKEDLKSALVEADSGKRAENLATLMKWHVRIYRVSAGSQNCSSKYQKYGNRFCCL